VIATTEWQSLAMQGCGASPILHTKEVGQKVFRHFDPLLHILRQKLAILDTLEFQGSFFIPENPKKHPTYTPNRVGKKVGGWDLNLIISPCFVIFNK